MTLMEMLIVISIIGILAAIALPAVRGMKQSNIMTSANRQLLDDLALARQYAIKNRSLVCVLFAPPIDPNSDPDPLMRGMPREQRDQLILGQMNSYRLFARRTVGDQPGRPTVRYLTGWKELPDGVFIAPEKFPGPQSPNGREYEPLAMPFGSRPMNTFAVERFPFPTSTNATDARFAYIEFDPQGRLGMGLGGADATPDGHAIIPLARGGVLHARDDNGYLWETVDAKETPPRNQITNYNFIVVNALTGRARVERPEIQ